MGVLVQGVPFSVSQPHERPLPFPFVWIARGGSFFSSIQRGTPPMGRLPSGGGVLGLAGLPFPGLAGRDLPGLAGRAFPGLAGLAFPGLAGRAFPRLAALSSGGSTIGIDRSSWRDSLVSRGWILVSQWEPDAMQRSSTCPSAVFWHTSKRVLYRQPNMFFRARQFSSHHFSRIMSHS